MHKHKASNLPLNRKAIFSVLAGVVGLVMVPPLFSLLAIGLGSCAVKEASDDRLVEKVLSLVGLGLGLIGVGATGAWISFVLITLALTMLLA